MKYFLIVGEASGDLHAANLMHALKALDNKAEFRFFGGDLMKAEGGMMLKHYKDLAYMGFIPVLMHSHTILKNMKLCKRYIVNWKPDALILVDYPGFNLSIAKYIKAHSSIPVYYYISPKIWAWKEYRIKNIKRDVDELFSILPFEVEFYKSHDYNIRYVGNPTVNEVAVFKSNYTDSFELFTKKNNLSQSPVLALLAGSRKQEIKDNLPMMIEASSSCKGCQVVLAGAPGISSEYYNRFLKNTNVKIVYNKTYELLFHSRAALVTSGTATLETALFGVPQVVCYYTPIGKIMSFLKRHFLHVKYISLVNLIADCEIVAELTADKMTVPNMVDELMKIYVDGDARDEMLADYEKVVEALGSDDASTNAAKQMIALLSK